MWWIFGDKRRQAYRRYLLEHKKGVTKAGSQLGVPRWRLFIHDWDKFLPRMFKAYAEQFYDLDGNPQRVEETDEFKRTWNTHQKISPHHYQHYILTNDSGVEEILQMPRWALLEMIADWMSFEMNGKGKTVEWYQKTKETKKIHPTTRAQIEKLLGV